MVAVVEKYSNPIHTVHISFLLECHGSPLMDDIPDFPPFAPAGLPTIVAKNAAAVTKTRAQLCTRGSGYEEEDAVTFALHTLSVRDGLLTPVPIYDACNEAAIRRHVNMAVEMDSVKRDLMMEENSKAFEPPVGCHAFITGQTITGWKVGFVIPFRPFCEVEMENVHGEQSRFMQYLGSLAWSLQVDRVHVGVHWHLGCRFKGFIPDAHDPMKRKTFLYARVSFPNIQMMETGARRIRGGMFPPRNSGFTEKAAYKVYEDRIDVDQKFVDVFNLMPSGWHRVRMAALVATSTSARHLLVNEEFFLRDASQLTQVETLTPVPPMLVACIDAEMNGHVPSRFPKAYRATDNVVVISLVFTFAGGGDRDAEGVEFERQAFVLGDCCDPIDGVIVRLFDDELEMIAAVRDELFVRKMVDIVTGHNIVKFDMEYLTKRIMLSAGDAPCRRFLRFGALIAESLTLREKRLSSAGMGSNTLQLLFGAGFAYVDTMLICKQSHKLMQNTLSFAAGTFLGDDVCKFDMPYELIPIVANGTNTAHWRLLTAYCVQDCILVVRLLKKWDSIKDLVAQSRVINIPLAVNVVCGQQQRVRDSLMKKARTMNMVMNGVNERVDVTAENVSAEGGWVIESVAGLHEKPVVVLDFASLYPSVQREHNLCWSTVIDDISSITAAHRAAGLVVTTYVTATGTYHIASNVPGVFPLQLKDLLDARCAYKKEMGSAEYGTPEYQNADAKQKATKIVMNSGYGTANCEEGKGIMPCKAVGTITCLEGRKLNQRADLFCASDPRFNAQTLYGDTDSIMVYFPETELYARLLREEGREPTRKERLQYAMDKGLQAEQVLNDEVFRSDVIKTECEKVYFPFRPRCKKTYAGLKFEPKDVKNATDNLDRPNKALGISGGVIEAKGMRMVRRDVPVFVREMTRKLLDALFFERDLDLFWDIVHTYTERVCHLEFDLGAFELTKELKDAYWTQKDVAPHIAVSYAREYARAGSGYMEGDRVAFVIVEEADAQRMIKPSWLNTDTVPDVVADHGAPKPHKETLDTKRSMCARHMDEVVRDPLHNHIDTLYYVEMGICSVLDQLAPDDVGAIAELLTFAKRSQYVYQSTRKQARSVQAFMTVERPELTRTDAAKMLPTLSHRRPVTRTTGPPLPLFECAKAEKRKVPTRKVVPPARLGNLSAFM